MHLAISVENGNDFAPHRPLRSRAVAAGLGRHGGPCYPGARLSSRSLAVVPDSLRDPWIAGRARNDNTERCRIDNTERCRIDNREWGHNDNTERGRNDNREWGRNDNRERGRNEKKVSVAVIHIPANHRGLS